MSNIFDLSSVTDFSEEIFQNILKTDKVKIERIISNGQTTPEGQWLDSDQNEWVILLQGEAKILFEGQESVHLSKGNYLFIPKKTRHRVTFTGHYPPCIWLAIHF